jgi:aminoglycoside 3-N-acetyltransferase
MMEHNLDGDKPFAHGPNSSWKFCVDKNAMVVGIGIDLTHYNTLGHVVEDAYGDWPVNKWRRERKFKIIDGEYSITTTVMERCPEWGKLYLADRNANRDMIKNKIMHIENVDGVEVSIMNSRDCISYSRLRNQKTPGYPYVIPRKYLLCSGK